MTIVCVDDHSVMLKGTKRSVEQILPDASIVAFTNAGEALAFVKENGCDVLISEIELCGVDDARFFARLAGRILLPASCASSASLSARILRFLSIIISNVSVISNTCS